MAKLTTADKEAIAKMKLPPWIDRDKDIKVVTVDGKKAYEIAAVLPSRFRRPRMLNVSKDTRIRNVDKDKWVCIVIGEEQHFYRVAKAGTLRVKYRSVNRRSVCCTGGTAVLVLDGEMERNMNPGKWKAKE